MFVIVVIAIALTVVILVSGYVKSPPDVAYIISGIKKKPRILIGAAGIKIPFFERLDKLSLGAIQIDVKTRTAVPTAEYINVRVDSTVSVQVGRSEEMITLAAQNFLNIDRQSIATKINDLLEGNVREIVGQMKLIEMVSDRKAFSEKVQQNVVPDLAKFGLELISFNVQNFFDEGGVIENLGIDNVEQIRKNAAIAKSDAKREIAVAEALNDKKANDARIQADEEMAIRKNEFEMKQAALKKSVDTAKAQADAAQGIEKEKQRQLKEVASVNANIAKVERESELTQKQIKIKEYELDALVCKEADANKYATEKAAEANLIKRKKDAEAKAYEIEQTAKAQKIRAEADKYIAEMQAAGIAAIGKAEAEAIREKAEAQKLMSEASIIEMVINKMPQIVASAAQPLEKVDKIVLYGEGGNAKIVGDVMKTTNQVMEGVKEATGLDITEILTKVLNKK